LNKYSKFEIWQDFLQSSKTPFEWKGGDKGRMEVPSQGHFQIGNPLGGPASMGGGPKLSRRTTEPSDFDVKTVNTRRLKTSTVAGGESWGGEAVIQPWWRPASEQLNLKQQLPGTRNTPEERQERLSNQIHVL
jgi:hypothetical protein